MSQLRIAIADDDAHTDRAAWWCAEIPRHWPRADLPPTCECVSFASLDATLAEHAGGRRQPGCPVIVLATEAEHSRSKLMQLLDRLIGSHTPAVVLTDDPESLRPELEAQGIPVEALNTDPRKIATIAHALVTRQTTIELLATDLHVARAQQGGLSGEIGKLHEELQLAGSLQRRSLPKQLPEMEGYEFGVFFRPCGYVSGDIYDAVRIDEHRVAFVLADAVGHGVPAALLTLVIIRALRGSDEDTTSDHPLASPAETLDRVNLELCEQNQVGDRFATAVCGVIDTATGTVTLASAGHPPALVVDPAGAVTAVEGGEGPLLGVFAEAEYTETSFALDKGHTLLFYSDGFETAFPEPDAAPDKAAANEAYIEHFARATTHASDQPGGMGVVLEHLAVDVDAQAGSLNQRDDLTLVALRRLALVGVESKDTRSAA